MARKLTDKQQRFVEEYLIDLNATKAAIRAGYSEKHAESQAYQLLQKTPVRDAIAAAKQERAHKTKIDSAYVLNRLVEIDQMDVCDILDDEGNLLPIRQWPRVWRRTLSGMDVNEIMSGDVQTVIRKIKWPDKVKNLELIGKHVDVQAWKEQLNLSGNVTLAQVLDAME